MAKSTTRHCDRFIRNRRTATTIKPKTKPTTKPATTECQKWCGCTHRVSGRRRATPRFTSELPRGPSLRGAVLLGPPETAERTLLPDKSLTNETYFQCGLKLRLRRPAPLAAHFAVLSAAIRRASSRD